MTLANAQDFEPALGDLQTHLPSWWAAQNEGTEMYLVAEAMCAQIDMVSALWEQPYLDQVITTASAQGLFHNFAFAWGLQNEQLPNVLPLLAAYIQARAAEDGSIASLIATLTTLLNAAPNVTGGTVLMFDAGGAGLTFPENGYGLVLYEFAPGEAPSASEGLVFPANGSGLRFPIAPTSLPSDNVIVKDGTSPLGAGPGLTFSQNQFVEIVPDYVTCTMTVSVLNWLTFDRGAFARAVERFQDACWFPTVVNEVPSF